jgi:hypothetical protein
MFRKFQWSQKNGIYNIQNLKSFEEIGHRSANIYGYWYKIMPDPYIGENCYIVWIDDIVFMKNIKYLTSIQSDQNFDKNIPIIAKDYLKLKRDLMIDILS